MRPAPLAVASLLLLCPSGHAATVSVALAPLEQVNLPRSAATRLHQTLARELRASAAVRPLRLLSAAPACELREPACLQRLRRELKVQRLLVLRAGRLGQTLVLRLTAYALSQGTRQGSWQEVIREQDKGTATAEQQALRRMVLSFAPLPEPPPAKPWYTRWWVWTAVGVAVAGGVTAAVLATRPEEHPYSIRPP